MLNMLTLYHSTSIGVDFDMVKPGKDGGIHMGTYRQAKMRNLGHIYEVKINPQKVRRCKDPRDGWAKKIRRAKAQGFDAIVYLNRYEGLDRQNLLHRINAGFNTDEMERMSDREFRKLFPEARDSYVIFDMHPVRKLIQHEHRIQCGML